MLIHMFQRALQNLVEYSAIIATLILYQWIKELRYKYRLTQADLAEFLDVDVTTVQRWERGTHKPNGQHLYQIQQLELQLDEVMKHESLHGCYQKNREQKYELLFQLANYGVDLKRYYKRY